MKRTLTLIPLFTVLMSLCTTAANAEVPEWVGAKPHAEGWYYGVGTASSAEADHTQKAQQAALADLIREISLTISADMRQQTTQRNDELDDVFAVEMQSHSDAYLEGHELVGTYDDGTDYWCCYRLSRAKYEEVLARRMAEAAEKGYDFAGRAAEAAQRGDLTGAVALYAEGLEVVAPFEGRNLTHQGVSVDNMLQHGLSALLGNISVVLEPQTVEVEPFSSQIYPVKVRVQSGTTPLASIPLTARFTEGAGRLTTPAATSVAGESTFSVSDITSRNPVQSVLVTADLESLLKAYRGNAAEKILNKYVATRSQATLTLRIAAQGLTAYCRYAKPYDDESVLRAVSSYLSANYFEMAKDALAADVLVDVTVSYRPGETVKGEMYDMREGFISAKVEMTDRVKGTVVATFGVDDVRTLAPVGSNDAKLRKQASRELLRKLKPEMKRRMASTRFTPKARTTDDDDGED